MTLEGVARLHKQTGCLLNSEHKIEFHGVCCVGVCMCVYMFHVQLMRMLMTCGKQLDAIQGGTAGGRVSGKKLLIIFFYGDDSVQHNTIRVFFFFYVLTTAFLDMSN